MAARGRRLRHCVPGRVTGEGFMRRMLKAVMDLGREPLSVEVAPAEVGLTLRAKDSLTLWSQVNTQKQTHAHTPTLSSPMCAAFFC